MLVFHSVAQTNSIPPMKNDRLMTPSTPWQLPDYIEDVLPGEAATLESLRRLCLDELSRYGYAWVCPPMVENLDTLLTGTGQDLNPLTFKVVDQRSGKTLGLRADMTPQVARIDSHIFSRFPLNRLCYCGTVLHTQPSPLHDSREIWQLGAELYGSAHLAADHEIIGLALRLMERAGLKDMHLVVGHVELFEVLTHDLDEGLQKALFDALQSKDLPLLQALTSNLDSATQEAIVALSTLYGEAEPVLKRARQLFKLFPVAYRAIDQIEALLSLCKDQLAEVRVHLDLGELPSYQYHTGLVFSIYVEGQHRSIARGGRYDRLGTSRGCSRPATGFSLDLRALAASAYVPIEGWIVAPYHPEDQNLAKAIQELRNAGRSVWVHLPNEADVALPNGNHSMMPSQISHRLEHQQEGWVVVLV